MAKRIKIPNPTLSNNEQTFISSDYTSGLSLTVLSNLTFANNDVVVVGKVGDEQTEAIDATGISGNTTISLSASLKWSHNKETIVYKSDYSQVEVHKRLTSGGQWEIVSLENIQWDKFETLVTDSTGTDDYEYKFRYYNPFSDSYSSFSHTLGGAGFTRNQVGRMVMNVRIKVRDPNRVRFTDTQIIEKLADGSDVVQGIRDDWWFLKVDTVKDGNGIATLQNVRAYSLDTYSDLNYLERVRFYYNDGTTQDIYDLDPLDEREFDSRTGDQNDATDDHVSAFKLLPPDETASNGYIYLDPKPKTSNYGTIYPVYFKKMERFSDVSDETPIAIPEVLETYAAWKLESDRGNMDRAEIFKRQFYGPSPQDKDRRELEGIALLEKLNGSKRQVVGQPESLIVFRGQRGARRVYSNRNIDMDEMRERFF